MLICKETIKENTDIRKSEVLLWNKIAIKSSDVDVNLYSVDKILDIGSVMVKTCIEDGGIGLAAPQIGIYKNIVIVQDMDEDSDSYKTKPYYEIFVNPVFSPNTDKGKSIREESCLSVPGKSYPISRWNEIDVSFLTFQNGYFEKTEKTLFGMRARVLQHELNHLNKISIVDVWKRQNKN